jgi:CO/xanthine dehydrogenase FAD-binding subunit
MAVVRLDVVDGQVREAAVSVGSCSPVAARLPAVEAALANAPMDDSLAALVQDADVAAALTPIADIRGDADYRYDAAAELVRRAVRDLVDERVVA